MSMPSPHRGAPALNDARGGLLERFVTALELGPKTIYSIPTFAVGYRLSAIDVTFSQLS